MPEPPDSVPDSSYDLAPVFPSAGERPPPKADSIPTGISQAATTPVEHNCPHCGFHIVGKPRNNRCPDCNAALDELTTGLLQFAPTGWTRKISTGALIVAVGILVHACGFLVVFLQFHRLNSNLVHTAAASVLFIGTLMLTARQPNSPKPRPRLALMAVILAGLAVVCWAIGMAHSASLRTVAEAAALLILAVFAFALCFYASELSARIPNDSLIQHFRLLPYVLLGFFAALAIADVADPEILRSYLELFFCSFPALGAMGGILLWAVITLLRLSIELRQAATAADAIALRRERNLAKQKRSPGNA